MGGSILLLAVAACGYVDPPPDPVALERRAVESRLAIRTLHVKLTIEREWYDRYGQSGKGGKVMQFEIWQDATHYRTDIFTESTSMSRDLALGRRHVMCKNCEQPGHAILYFEGTGGAALAHPDNHSFQRDLFDRGEAFDPRLLGYTSSDHVNMPRPATAKNLGLDIISPERSPPTVEAATVDGEAAWVLKSKSLRSGFDHRAYIFPGKGGSVGLIEYSGKVKDDSFRSRHHSELERDARTGIWFPKKLVGEWFENGALKDRDVVTVHLREFNQPIDPSVFTLAGMNVREGEEVYDPAPNRTGKDRPRMQYRGGQIVPYKKESLTQPPPPETVTQPRPVDPSVVPGRFRWWYAAAAVLFGLAAVLLLYRAVRRRTA
jgi:hypothetical protein